MLLPETHEYLPSRVVGTICPSSFAHSMTMTLFMVDMTAVLVGHETQLGLWMPRAWERIRVTWGRQPTL